MNKKDEKQRENVTEKKNETYKQWAGLVTVNSVQELEEVLKSQSFY